MIRQFTPNCLLRDRQGLRRKGEVMKKILIACDDSALAMLYSMELTEEGYDTVVASDWDPATESIERDRPDLVLVDWNMNRYRDSDFCRTVQDDPYRIPVLHCLDYPPAKQDRQFLCSDYFVLKSSNLKKLKTAIKRIWEADSAVQGSGRQPPTTELQSVPPTQISFGWE
jgi:CheY-like chemotaxis protein